MARIDENTASDWRAVLHRESEGADESFTMKLREGNWDHSAFQRVFVAMRECCKAHDGQQSIERWIAEVFWYLHWYSKQQIEELGLSDSPYYQNGVTNFDHLAFWLFVGESRRDDEFEPMSSPPPPQL